MEALLPHHCWVIWGGSDLSRGTGEQMMAGSRLRLRGQWGAWELEEGVSQVSRWLPPAELLHSDRKVNRTRVVNVWMRQPASGPPKPDLFFCFFSHRLLILPVDMLMCWTARGITLHCIISVTSGSLSCSQAPIKVGVLLYYSARKCF